MRESFTGSATPGRRRTRSRASRRFASRSPRFEPMATPALTGNSKLETRSSKQTPNARNVGNRRGSFSVFPPFLSIRICFEFRVSSFEFSFQPQHILHVVQPRRPPVRPERGSQRAARKGLAARGLVRQLHALALRGKNDRVIADDVAPADRVNP